MKLFKIDITDTRKQTFNYVIKANMAATALRMALETYTTAHGDHQGSIVWEEITLKKKPSNRVPEPPKEPSLAYTHLVKHGRTVRSNFDLETENLEELSLMPKDSY